MQLIGQFKIEIHNEEELNREDNNYKPEDIYEPESITDDENDRRYMMKFEIGETIERNIYKRKRKSRWGDKTMSVPPPNTVMLSNAGGSTLPIQMTPLVMPVSGKV